VYSSAGALVKSLRSGTVAGSTYRFAWDGKTDNGAPLPPGTYMCILTDRSGMRMSKNLVFLIEVTEQAELITEIPLSRGSGPHSSCAINDFRGKSHARPAKNQ
jgi:hypothetical protein